MFKILICRLRITIEIYFSFVQNNDQRNSILFSRYIAQRASQPSNDINDVKHNTSISSNEFPLIDIRRSTDLQQSTWLFGSFRESSSVEHHSRLSEQVKTDAWVEDYKSKDGLERSVSSAKEKWNIRRYFHQFM